MISILKYFLYHKIELDEEKKEKNIIKCLFLKCWFSAGDYTILLIQNELHGYSKFVWLYEDCDYGNN